MATTQSLPPLIVFFFLSAAVIEFAAGRLIVEKQSISVISPKSLQGRHEAAMANFGVPNYGGSLTGVVVYPEKGRTACSAFDGDRFRSKSKRPVILIVDRGSELPIRRFLCSSIKPRIFFNLV